MATKKRGLQYTDEQAGVEQGNEAAHEEPVKAKEKTLANVFAETKEGAKIELRAPGGVWCAYTRTADGYERDVVIGFHPGPEHSFVNKGDFDGYEWRMS